MGRFHVVCGQGAAVTLRKAREVQEVSLGPAGGGGGSGGGEKFPFGNNGGLTAFVSAPSRSCVASRDPYCGWVAEGACRKVVGNIK